MKSFLPFIIILSIGITQSLTKEEKQIKKHVEKNMENAIDLLEKVVNIYSGSLNIKGNRKVG